MKVLAFLILMLGLTHFAATQPLQDDDNRRDGYSGIDRRDPDTGLLRVQVNGASRKGIGRINDKDVSFVWMHEPVRKGYIGFRVKLTMMPRLGSGIEKQASPDPLGDVDVNVSIGGNPARIVYQSRISVEKDRGTFNYTASVPKTEYHWVETIKPDGTRVRERQPKTVYVNESRSARYDYWVGEFDVIAASPDSASDRDPIVFNIRYGKAKQSANWTWGQFEKGGWIDRGDSDLNKGSDGPSFVLLPVQASTGVRFERIGFVEDTILDTIRGGRGDAISRRKVERAADSLNLDLDNPRRLREDDFVRLGRDLRADYVILVVVDDLYGDSVTLKVWVADIDRRQFAVEGRNFIGRDNDQDGAIRLAVEDLLKPYLRRRGGR
jgi:hypothetical protein